MRPLLLLLPATVLGQTAALSFRPVEAEYSAALERIIMAAPDPSRLYIYDPAAKTSVTVALPRAPLSLSVSPNGLFAAVGHADLVSYVNLTTAAVEKTFPVTGQVVEMALAPEWIYSRVFSIRISTGAVTAFGNSYYGTGLRLHPTGRALYGTRDFVSPNDLHRFEIGTGPITSERDSPFHGEFSICGDVWFSPNGRRIYNSCGTIFLSSTDTARDMTYLTSFRGPLVTALSESAAANRVAIVPKNSYSSSPADEDRYVRLFDSEYLRPAGRFPLPDFTAAGKPYAARGKWIFFNNAGSRLYVVMQADTASGLLNDFAVQTLDLGSQSSCATTFDTDSADVPFTGTSGSVNVTAAYDCVRAASASVPWIVVTGGALGSGKRAVSYQVRANGGGPRTGSITFGSQMFTINQDGAPAAPPPARRLSYNVVDSQYDKPLDRLVMVSSDPDELHLFDAATGNEQVTALPAAPMAVSVRPDGLQAAVGHDGWVSLVNLQNGTVEKTIEVGTEHRSLVLAGNGYVYLFPVRTWSDIYSLAIGPGGTTGIGAIYTGRIGRLHPSGNYIYTEGTKWDIRGGAPVSVTSNYSATCGAPWITEPGNRLVMPCGSVLRSSETPSLDFQPNGSLGIGLAWADHSQTAGAIAAIPAASYSSSAPVDDTEVRLFRDADLALQRRYFLPKIEVGGAGLPTRGKQVFWNKAASRLIALLQVDPAAVVAARFAVAEMSVSGCAVTAGASEAQAGSASTTGTVTVTAAGSCSWTASTDSAWLSVTAGVAGTGSGAVNWAASANGSSAARTGRIFIGDQTVTITQAGVTATVTITASSTVMPSSYCSSYLNVQVSPSYATWTATTPAQWLTLTSYASGGGHGTVSLSCAVNTGPARSAVISILGSSVTVTQAGTAIGIAEPVEGQTVNTSGVTFRVTPTDGAGYLFEVKSGASTVFSGSLAGSQSTTTLVSLPAGPYTLYARACSSAPFTAANCGASAQRSFTVNPPAPTAAPAVGQPTGGQAFTASTQTFSWSAVAGASRYEVLLRDMAAGGATALSTATTGTSTVFSMKSSSEYRLQVRACIEACGPWSAAVTFAVTLPAIPASAPGTPVCTVSGTRVTCNWPAVAGADLYRVQVVQPAGGPGGGALTVASRQTSATSVIEPDPLIVPVGAASVVVAGCNGNGCGPNSEGASISVAGPNSLAPVLGTPAAGTAIEGPEVLFSWNRIPGDTGSNTTYRLYVQDLARAAPALDVLTTSNFHAAKFRGEGSRYDAVVIANPAAASPARGPASGFVLRGGNPQSPTMVEPRHQTATVSATIPSGNVQIGWTPLPGATLYEYFVARSGDSAPTARGVTPGLVIQAPIGSGLYNAIVRACPAGVTCSSDSDVNWGPWSNAAGQTGVTTFRTF